MKKIINNTKKAFNFFRSKKETSVNTVAPSRAELEKMVVENAKKTVSEYSNVFKRLADYDRV